MEEQTNITYLDRLKYVLSKIGDFLFWGIFMPEVLAFCCMLLLGMVLFLLHLAFGIGFQVNMTWSILVGQLFALFFFFHFLDEWWCD